MRGRHGTHGAAIDDAAQRGDGLRGRCPVGPAKQGELRLYLRTGVWQPDRVRWHLHTQRGVTGPPPGFPGQREGGGQEPVAAALI